MPAPLRNSLHRPHDRLYQSDPGHNLTVVELLVSANRFLKSFGSDPDAFYRASECAASCFLHPMSARQYMQASYILGMAFIGGDALTSGLSYLDQALDMAKRLHNWGAFTELSYLHASTSTKLLRYGNAGNYLGHAVDTLRTLNVERDTAYIALEVDMLITLAMCAFSSEDYAYALRSLKEAEVYANQLAAPERQFATICWIRAILCRGLDDPISAWSLGWQAAEVYSKTHTPTDELSWGRLQRELTDFTLDIVEAQAAERQKLDEYLMQAGGLAAQAVHYAQQGHDDIGEGLALLAQARYQRLTGHTPDALAMIKRALRIAKDTDDLALKVQGHTALGFAYRAQNQTEASLNCFRLSVDLVRLTDISVMSAPARKELIRAAQDYL